MQHGGQTWYREVNSIRLKYRLYNYERASVDKGSLIDGGANGGMSGDDVIVLEKTNDSCDVTGVAQNSIDNLAVCTVAGLVQSTTGPIIAIFSQYAHYGKGKTVHSASQLRSFGLDVNDISRKLPGGKQRIQTPDGYVIPLSVRAGLAYMDMRPPLDTELED
jgi:hypothetical protein